MADRKLFVMHAVIKNILFGLSYQFPFGGYQTKEAKVILKVFVRSVLNTSFSLSDSSKVSLLGSISTPIFGKLM